MKLICTMPVRNEDWCLGLTARAVLLWCDMLVIYLHACTDRSSEIAAEVEREHPGRVVVMTDEGSVWTEMSHRQSMLETARYLQATHIALVDADEILTGNLITEIRPLIERQCRAGVILNLPWIALARDPMVYITGSSYWGAERQNVTMAFMDRNDYHWATRNGYDFHQRPPIVGPNCPPKQFIKAPVSGGLMHLQFLSERRLRAKQALYQMTEVLKTPDNMLGQRATREQVKAAYGRAVYESDPMHPGVTTEKVPREWWDAYYRVGKQLLFSGAGPWQEVEVKRLLAEHGREKFAGLDLFGYLEIELSAFAESVKKGRA